MTNDFEFINKVDKICETICKTIFNDPTHQTYSDIPWNVDYKTGKDGKPQSFTIHFDDSGAKVQGYKKPVADLLAKLFSDAGFEVKPQDLTPDPKTSIPLPLPSTPLYKSIEINLDDTSLSKLEEVQKAANRIDAHISLNIDNPFIKRKKESMTGVYALRRIDEVGNKFTPIPHDQGALIDAAKRLFEAADISPAIIAQRKQPKFYGEYYKNQEHTFEKKIAETVKIVKEKARHIDKNDPAVMLQLTESIANYLGLSDDMLKQAAAAMEQGPGSAVTRTQGRRGSSWHKG